MLYSELRMVAQQLDFQRTKSCRVLHTAAGMQCHLAAAIEWVVQQICDCWYCNKLRVQGESLQKDAARNFSRN
jgi:hypothetical protein